MTSLYNHHFTLSFFLSSLLRLNSMATPTSAWCRSWVNGCCSFNWTKQKSRSWLAPHDPTGYADWVTFCDNASPLYIQCCAQFFHLVIIGVKHLFYLGWITTSWGNMLCLKHLTVQLLAMSFISLQHRNLRRTSWVSGVHEASTPASLQCCAE